MTQPTALFLADVIDADAASAAHHGAAAYELRRLHEEVERLTRERDALLEALKELLWALRRISGRCDAEPAYKIARAAIAKAEGENT